MIKEAEDSQDFVTGIWLLKGADVYIIYSRQTLLFKCVAYTHICPVDGMLSAERSVDGYFGVGFLLPQGTAINFFL